MFITQYESLLLRKAKNIKFICFKVYTEKCGGHWSFIMYSLKEINEKVIFRGNYMTNLPVLIFLRVVKRGLPFYEISGDKKR